MTPAGGYMIKLAPPGSLPPPEETKMPKKTS